MVKLAVELSEAQADGIDVLPITVQHAIGVSTLPLHHRDPFDRLLIAQALAEGIPLVTADEALGAYAVQRLW